MEATVDVFLVGLPRDITEVVLRNFFRAIGNVVKVRIIDDKKSNNKLGFIGFENVAQATEAVKLADKSYIFGDVIKASIARKFDVNDSMITQNSDFNKMTCNGFEVSSPKSACNGFEITSPKSVSNVGRGRGNPLKRQSFMPSFIAKSIILTDVKLKLRELIEVEIVDLSNLEFICARPLKITEDSKVEITEQLTKVNSFPENLRHVDEPKVGEFYLGKWAADNTFYRVELLEIMQNDTFKVTFVDEGTYGDITSDIRHIPECPLQQYPKQFAKITIGCNNSEDLRNYIFTQSEGKKVSIFWLGEYQNGVPLINLFLGEEEIVEKFIQINKVYVRDSFALKFTDMPIHKSDADCSHVTFLQSTYKSVNDFNVQIFEPMTIQCSKKSPIVLPVPGDICIYEKRNGVNNVTYLRCVVKRRQLFSFDILLFDSGENLNNVSIDCLYAADECNKIAPPFTILCELDKSFSYSEDSFLKIMSDENMKFSIVSYKGNNRYVVSVSAPKEEICHYPDIILKKFIGQSNKVLVTHVVSPINFFVQIDRQEFVQTLNDIHEKLNINYRSSRFSTIDSVSIGQAVVAPFSADGGIGENFRAVVLEKRQVSPNVHVHYIDYGNDGWVDFKVLLKINDDINDEIVKRPALALHCTLNIDIIKEAWSHAIELFSQLSGFNDDSNSDLVMQVVGEVAGKLVIDLVSLDKGSVSKVMERGGMCRMRPDGDLSTPTVSQSVLCNGDARMSVPPASVVDESDDYSDLLKKLEKLELRVALLEKKSAIK